MIIKNATIVNADNTLKADIKVINGKIAEIGNITADSDDEVIDATNLYAIPGGIDVHTHLDLDVGIATASDSFFTGTRAAAIGGTTTIVDHIGFGPKDCSLKHQINAYHKLADGNAVIDYSFHGVFQHFNEDTFKEMKELVEEGITSYKVYLTYDYKMDDTEVIKILNYAKELGVIIAVHPENDSVIKLLKQKFKEEHKLSPIYHAKSRPIEAEGEAINRMIMLAKTCDDAPIYIVHLSNGLGLKMVNDAKNRGQKNLFVETCPQYLFLDEEVYNREDGIKYIMSPPLRSKENNDLLWDGIINNEVDIIGTDHCPFFYEKEKQMGKDDFTKCPNGAPGIELRMALMLSEGVNKNRISLERYVEICSEKPAKLFGMYPKKGVIAVGSDADIVLINKDKEVTVTKDILHENVDYTPYEGMKLKGYPVLTISKGKVIAKDGEFVGKQGDGEFIKREKSSLIK